MTPFAGLYEFAGVAYDPAAAERRLRAATAGGLNALLDAAGAGDEDAAAKVAAAVRGAFDLPADDADPAALLADFLDWRERVREAGTDLADFAAVYGLPAGLPAAALYALHLNADRVRARRQADAATAAAVALGREPPPDWWAPHLFDSPAEELAWQTQVALRELSGLARR